MTFAMKNMHSKIEKTNSIKEKNKCCLNLKKHKICKKFCCNLSNENKIFSFSSNNFSKKIVKVKIFSFVDISENYSKILENKNLIKNTSPPNIKRKIKYFSYLNLVKIIKSNT